MIHEAFSSGKCGRKLRCHSLCTTYLKILRKEYDLSPGTQSFHCGTRCKAVVSLLLGRVQLVSQRRALRCKLHEKSPRVPAHLILMLGHTWRSPGSKVENEFTRRMKLVLLMVERKKEKAVTLGNLFRLR